MVPALAQRDGAEVGGVSLRVFSQLPKTTDG